MASTKIRHSQIVGVTDPVQDQLDARVHLDGVIMGEEPTGLINGSNTIFTLANTPNDDTERVIHNGVSLEKGASNDYTISGGTITFNTAPDTGDKIIVDYIYGVTGTGGGGGGSNLTITTGVEIDTGDTLDGDPIYMKFIDAGAMPANTTKNVAHGISPAPNVISIEIFADNGTAQIPFAYVSGGSPRVTVNDTTVNIVTTSSWTGYNARMQLRYTKP